MHRRAHGGAWSAAVLMIGSCSASLAAEPPRTTSYSSGTGVSAGAISPSGPISNAAGSSNVSTFVPQSGPASILPSASNNGMTPVASSSATPARAIEIVPTPFVPYASVLAQQGKVFSPTTVANVPLPNPTVTPNSLGVTTSPGWIPKDTTRAAAAPIACAANAGVSEPATTSAPLVPVILPEAERELLEKALRGASGPSAAEAKPATTKPLITTSPIVTQSIPTSKVAESSGDNAVASATSSDRSAAEIEARALPVKPRDTAEKKSPAAKEDLASAGAAKLTPLPPLEREEPSTPAPTVNLPQPPIPLEYPRTGR